MSITNQTQSRQFKRWFGDWQNHPGNASKVVNPDGTPRVVYHGTDKDFTIFQSNDGCYWFSESEGYAESMAEERGSKTVMEVYLNMRRPYRAKLPPGQFSDPGYETPIIRAAKAGNYDGVIIEVDTSNEIEMDTFYVILNSSDLSSSDQVAALQSVSYESTGIKIRIGYENGLAPGALVYLKRILPEFDENGNGSYS